MAEAVETSFEGAELNASGFSFDGLLPALERLDRLLDWAVTAAQTAYGPEAETDDAT